MGSVTSASTRVDESIQITSTSAGARRDESIQITGASTSTRVDESIQIVPPPGHPRPMYKTMDIPLEQWKKTLSTFCDMDQTLLNAVYDYFLYLVGRMPHASLTDDFCSRDGPKLVSTQRRILAAFGQCCNMPLFHFNMIKKKNIDHWCRLYHTAMRCSIHPCQSGFVFVTWRWQKLDRVAAHSTSIYLNLHTNQQIFIDPPSVHFVLNAHWIHQCPSHVDMLCFDSDHQSIP